MFGRVLAVTVTQVLRSIALVMLPTSFIALVAWATAGSATGNTGDPMRAAIWIWLAAHQIPFSLALPPAKAAGLLSYLPLGAIIAPIFAVRSGIKRSLMRLDNDQSLAPLARVLFITLYSLAGTLFALLSSSPSVKPIWYVAPIFLLPLTLLCAASVGRRVVFGQAIYFGARIMAFLIGIASIVLGISIFMNLTIVKNLTLVLEPGVFGGLLLLLLNILYLPNAAIATLGYFSGVGFAVGSHTIISPLSFTLNSIPAFPLLGALPKGASLIALLGIAIIIFSGALLVSWTIALNSRTLFQSLFVFTLLTAVVAYAGSGALITGAMSAMGVSPWKFTLAVAGELSVGALLALYLPRMIKR